MRYLERRTTGDTIGQHWVTLKTDGERREFLRELGMVIRVRRGRKSEDPFEDDIPDVVAFEDFDNPDHLNEFISEDVRRSLDLSLDDPDDADDSFSEDIRSSPGHD